MLQWHSRSVLHSRTNERSSEEGEDRLEDAVGRRRGSQLPRSQVVGQNRRRSSRRNRECYRGVGKPADPWLKAQCVSGRLAKSYQLELSNSLELVRQKSMTLTT